MMGGSLAHEFMFLYPAGEDDFVLCERAVTPRTARLPVAGADPVEEQLLAVEEVATPDTTTIDSAGRIPGRPDEPDRQGCLLRTGPAVRLRRDPG